MYIKQYRPFLIMDINPMVDLDGNSAANTQLIVPPGSEELFRFYRMQLLPDGFPGATPIGLGLPNASVQPHPLYGVYLIRMSLDAWEAQGENQLLQQAVRAGYAAINRMDWRSEALIFIYPQNSAFNRLNRDYYSALTQVKYVTTFWRLYLITKDDLFKTAADAAFSSLTIPIEEGGVMVRRPEGISFEEAPHPVPTFILNGWLSILENIYRFAKKAKSKKGLQLFHSSISLLKTLLPYYDMPKFKTSRYALAGSVPFKLQLSHNARVVSGLLVTPHGISVPFEIGKPSERWSIGLDKTTGEISGNFVFPIDSIFKMTRIELTVESDYEGTIEFLAPPISYNPLRGAQYHKDFRRQRISPLAIGTNNVVFKLKSKPYEISAYPTNFKKKIAGKHYNVYHFMHIKSLRQLHQITGDSVFKNYADKWFEYTRHWPSMQIYQHKNIELKCPPTMQI
ncbi:hypothetical protein WN50_34485 [Limnoraphis robusta CS-951]|uniref:D-glucuronyl C5-epimerase C-terminal domain-containing protein n=2 Tax=Limnoraphis TaxID=1332112 RepID=A0A0F5YIC4_9CYAN|nr:hypothetical protein WN50_11490 [Limnoraphis robusta CS-951]KMW70537.1 hypothetical protein WN50_34485 [Limnoraphis robusta CS-951]